MTNVTSTAKMSSPEEEIRVEIVASNPPPTPTPKQRVLCSHCEKILSPLSDKIKSPVLDRVRSPMLDRIRSPVLDRIRMAAAEKSGSGTRNPDESAIEVAEKLLPKDGNRGNFFGHMPNPRKSHSSKLLLKVYKNTDFSSEPIH